MIHNGGYDCKVQEVFANTSRTLPSGSFFVICGLTKAVVKFSDSVFLSCSQGGWVGLGGR